MRQPEGKILRPVFPDHEAEEVRARELKRAATTALRRRLKRWRTRAEWEPKGRTWCPPCPDFYQPDSHGLCGRCCWGVDAHG